MKNSYKPQEPYPNPERNPGPRWAFDMKPIKIDKTVTEALRRKEDED